MTNHTTRFDFPLDLDAEIARNVQAALTEDIGAGDLTSELVPAGNHSIATVIVREPAVVCGIDWFNRCFSVIGFAHNSDFFRIYAPVRFLSGIV